MHCSLLIGDISALDTDKMQVLCLEQHHVQICSMGWLALHAT